MSILLEALRKSEKNQRVREAPTIHSDDPSGSVSERLQAGPLAVLLIVALFVTGWLVWRQYQVPEGTYQPPVTLGADRNRTVAKPVAVDSQVEPAALSSPGATTTTNTSTFSGQGRTPVESYQPPVSIDSPTTNAGQGPAPGDTVASETGSTRPEQKANESSASSTLKPTANKTTSATGQEDYHPGEPAPIGYWELPDAIRAEVPEFKFSVLVFAADPADRFVLINGQRLGEGDTVQSGLVLKEIRRDGVVFSYRLYQFLVER